MLKLIFELMDLYRDGELWAKECYEIEVIVNNAFAKEEIVSAMSKSGWKLISCV